MNASAMPDSTSRRQRRNGSNPGSVPDDLEQLLGVDVVVGVEVLLDEA
jgi:hypothetical protein